jgi:hypothetical protein
MDALIEYLAPWNIPPTEPAVGSGVGRCGCSFRDRGEQQKEEMRQRFEQQEVQMRERQTRK